MMSLAFRFPGRSAARAVGSSVLLGTLVLGGCAGSAPAGRLAEPIDPEVELVEMRDRLATTPDDTEAWFRLGKAWQGKADVASATDAKAFRDSARVAFESLLERDPKHVRGLVHHGLVLEDLNRQAEALVAYERAATLAPDDPLPRINLGSLLYFHYRKTFEAKQELTRALEIDPDNPEAHFNLGVLFADANLFREAATEWERVIELDEDGPAGKLARENLERVRPVLESADGSPREDSKEEGQE